MSQRLLVSRPAEADLDEQAEYLGCEDPALAERFLAAATRAFRDLSETPGLGRLRKFHVTRLGGLRSWRIRGFENWLVFYRVMNEAVEIVRVLHGARDLEAAFEEEGDLEQQG